MIKEQGDPQVGGQFLKRIVDDIVLGKDVESMKELLGQLLPVKDKQTGELDVSEGARKGAAEKLIKSLNGLDKNDRPISNDAQAKIVEAFGVGDPSITTVDQLVGRLETLGVESRDLKNDKSLWALFAAGKNEFSMQMNQADLDNLRLALNRIAPGLGDLFGDLMSADCALEKQTPETEMRDKLAQVFDVMEGQVSFASFQGKEYEMKPNLNGEMEKVPLNVLNLNVMGDPDAFFGEGIKGADGKVMQYQFYHDDPKVYDHSFKSMVLDKWEADGTVKFAVDDPSTPDNENDIARANFIEKSQDLITGKMLDQSYIRQVNHNGEVLQFASLQDEAEFVSFIGGINPRHHTEVQIADQIMEYAKEHDGVGFRGGMTYEGAKAQLIEAGHNFVPVSGGREYADMIMDWADQHPDVTIYTKPEPVIQTPTGMSGAMPVRATPPVTPVVAATPTTTPTTTPTSKEKSKLATTTSAASNSAAVSGADQTKIDPEEPTDEIRLVGKVEPTEENSLSYGGPIEITEANIGDFAFRDILSVYSLDDKGTMTQQEITNEIGGHKLAPDRIDEILGGGDVKIQRVVEDGQFDRGYFVSNSTTGKGVYLDTRALDTEKMLADMKAKLLPDLKAEAAKLENKVTTPSVGAAPGQQQPDPNGTTTTPGAGALPGQTQQQQPDPNEPSFQQSMQLG